MSVWKQNKHRQPEWSWVQHPSGEALQMSQKGASVEIKRKKQHLTGATQRDRYTGSAPLAIVAGELDVILSLECIQPPFNGTIIVLMFTL